MLSDTNAIKTILIAVAISALLASISFAGDRRTQTVDFENDLIPVFTKSGYNALLGHGRTEKGLDAPQSRE